MKDDLCNQHPGKPHIPCSLCDECAFRWPRGTIAIDSHFASGCRSIREIACERCAFKVAEFFHPDLLDDAHYISNKDQILAALNAQG